MVATDGEILDEIFSPTLSARDTCKYLDNYYEKLTSKVSKGSALTAADAKKEGPTIIKLVNACLKQVSKPISCLKTVHFKSAGGKRI
jgi:hypothetical protein